MTIGLVGILAVAAFTWLGHRFPRFEQPVLRKGLRPDILHGLTNGPMLDIPIAYSLAAIATGLEASIGAGYVGFLSDSGLPAQLAVFLVVGDLVKWTLHMIHHRIPVLWRFHRLHHSSVELDAFSHARTHPVEVFTNRIVFATLFVVVAGIDPAIVSAYAIIDLVQGLWVHSNTNLKLGPLNYLLATQEFHHWHHADDELAENKNYGGFLSVWDWAFGTAYCPRNREVPAFGVRDLPQPPESYGRQLLLPFTTPTNLSDKAQS